MTTWYMLNSYGDKIEPVEVERETEQCVWAHRWSGSKRASRMLKVSDFSAFFPTWAAAHAALIRRYERQITSAQEALTFAQAALAAAQAMTPPVEVTS